MSLVLQKIAEYTNCENNYRLVKRTSLNNDACKEQLLNSSIPRSFYYFIIEEYN